MKKIVLIILCLWAFPVAASHIVGGEFETIHLSGNRYRINMILYFDKKFGSEGARDPNVNARIFRKRDNALMMDVFLPLVSEDSVDYTQPECSSGEIVTSKIVYTTVVTLSPGRYADPEGYYIAWERCCRNYGIVNVYSDDPTAGPNYAGQTFYLEFPPVVKNGQPFINSSPRLFPPLNDYACPYRPYYVDFGGVDDDGDSLVYTLVTPLNTKSADALPLPDLRPRPRPYPEVNYRPGYSLNNIIDGAPDLKISTEGFLTVTPRFNGLYVFAVRCEEFRDGEKIGELRRDFQMLVVDHCDASVPPRITGKKISDADFIHDEHMTLTFSKDTPDEERCIQVRVADKDVLSQLSNFTENITIKAIPIGFRNDVSRVLPDVTTATLVENDSIRVFDICFDRCPFIEDGPFQIGIVAYDDACSLPLTDTLKITVNQEPPANSNARITTPNVQDVLEEGNSESWPIAAIDDDGDSLIVNVVANGFNIEDAGIRIETVKHVDGSYEASLVWEAYCDIYDFTGRTTFDLKIIVEDADQCAYSHPDVMDVTLSVDLPENASPVVAADLTEEQLANGIDRKIFESLTFDVAGYDSIDNDQVRLMAQGNIFNLGTYGMSFPGATGVTYTESQFNWILDCNRVLLGARNIFEVNFIAVDDANKCRIYKADTLTVKVFAHPPDNSPPNLEIASLNQQLPFHNNEQDLFIGDQISLAITSVDTDISPQDHLVIEMIGVEGPNQPEGYTFSPSEGRVNIQSTFTWNPECSIFEDGVYVNDYVFTFRTYDDRCQNAKGDTVDVKMRVRDRSTEKVEFIPPNFVSADRDPELRNEFFAMVRIKDEVTGELEDILPLDNCLGHFVGITIYNRWGKRVFESSRRDFRWYPDEDAAGVYFYTLIFSDREYKGSVTVRN